MEKIDDTADFLKEEARIKADKRFDERLKRNGLVQYMMLAAAFSSFTGTHGMSK